MLSIGHNTLSIKLNFKYSAKVIIEGALSTTEGKEGRKVEGGGMWKGGSVSEGSKLSAGRTFAFASGHRVLIPLASA